MAASAELLAGRHGRLWQASHNSAESPSPLTKRGPPAAEAADRAVALGVDVTDLVVKEVVRRRRRSTKEPFCYVRVEGPAGDERLLQVSDDGKRVDPERGTLGLDWPRR